MGTKISSRVEILGGNDFSVESVSFAAASPPSCLWPSGMNKQGFGFPASRGGWQLVWPSEGAEARGLVTTQGNWEVSHIVFFPSSSGFSPFLTHPP